MESPSIRLTGLFKTILLTGLCGLLVITVIQIDLPTFRDLADSLQIEFVEHQLKTGSLSQEELLREGWLYYNLGQYEKARQFMIQAASDDANISAYYCLGMIDMRFREFENAIEKFNIVAAKSPKHAATRMALGQAYYQLQYWGPAALEFEKAVSLEPADEAARLWLGKTYISLNQTEKARHILASVTHGRESAEAAVLLKNINEK